MYRDNNFHSRRQLRIKVSLRILSLYAFKQKLDFKKPKLCFKAGFPVFAVFKDELEARKLLKAFFLLPK